MAEEQRTVSFLYEKNKDAKTIPVSGAYGGAAPDNSGIIAHFFLEYASIPYSTEFNVEKSNQVIDVRNGKNVSRGDYTREVVATTFMNAESAIIIGKWLIENGEALIERRKNTPLNL